MIFKNEYFGDTAGEVLSAVAWALAANPNWKVDHIIIIQEPSMWKASIYYTME